VFGGGGLEFKDITKQTLTAESSSKAWNMQMFLSLSRNSWGMEIYRPDCCKYFTLISRHMAPHFTISTATNGLLHMTADVFNIFYLVLSVDVTR